MWYGLTFTLNFTLCLAENIMQHHSQLIGKMHSMKIKDFLSPDVCAPLFKQKINNSLCK